MSKRRKPLSGRPSAEEITARVAHRASGAAGVHDDQNARRHRVGRTNRVGSRSARRRGAIEDDQG